MTTSNRRIATVAPAGTSGTQGVLSTFAYDAAGNLTASRTWAALRRRRARRAGRRRAILGGAYRETVHSHDALDRLKTTTPSWPRASAIGTAAPGAYATDVTLTTSYDYDVVGNGCARPGRTGGGGPQLLRRADRKTAQVDAGSWLTTWSWLMRRATCFPSGAMWAGDWRLDRGLWRAGHARR